MPRQHLNNAGSTLLGPISNSATSLDADDAANKLGTPTVSDPIRYTIEQGTTREIIEATGRTGNTLTGITRAVERCYPDAVATAYSFIAGAKIEVRATAASFSGGSTPTRPTIIGSVAGFYWRGGGSDLSAGVGNANQSSNGTATGRAYAAGIFGQQTRGGFVSVAAANSPAGRVIPFGSSAVNPLHNEAIRYSVGLGVSDTTFQSTASIFAGGRMNSGTPGDPATLTTSPFVCFGNSPGDTTMSIFHSSGGGSVTKIDLGANFPHNATGVDFFIVELYRPPGTANWEYFVRNLANNATASGIITTNVPAVLNGINWHTNRNTIAGTTAVGIDINSILVETGWVR